MPGIHRECRRLQWREIIRHHRPYDRGVNAMIFVADHVADGFDIRPRNLRPRGEHIRSGRATTASPITGGNLPVLGIWLQF